MEYYYSLSSPKEAVVWLKPAGLTQGVNLPGAYMLILHEEGGRRHLPVLLDRAGFELLVRATKRHEYPATHAMVRLARTFGLHLGHVVLRPAASGRMRARLTWQPMTADAAAKTMDMEAAEAIAVALETGRPVGIGQADFERLYNRHGSNGQVTVPISSMGTDLLRQAIDLAVENDNFELASQLRDELRVREARQPEAPARDADTKPTDA